MQSAKDFSKITTQKNDLLSRTEFYNFGETIQDVDDKISSL